MYVGILFVGHGDVVSKGAGSINLQSLSSVKHLSRCRTRREHRYFHLLDSGVGMLCYWKRKGKSITLPLLYSTGDIWSGFICYFEFQVGLYTFVTRERGNPMCAAATAFQTS